MMPQCYIIMGVAGCGKTEVGRLLSQSLRWDFYDADDFHPHENILKMANGIPLDDADRAPWLAALHDLISASRASNLVSWLVQRSSNDIASN